MRRLIDANKLPYYPVAGGNLVVYKDDIENAPTVDAVEVVRCRECKCWDSETGFCDIHSRFYHGGLDWDMFNEDDFCSQGEK